MKPPHAVSVVLAAVLCGAVTGANAKEAGRARGGVRLRTRANPVRRVVAMLQVMQQKVQDEGKIEQEAFDKFMAYCQEEGASLAKAITAGEERVPQLESDITEATSTIAQLTEELKQHRQDVSDAEASVDKATTLRNSAADNYAKESSSYTTNIAACGKAIGAFEKNSVSAFLQTDAADVLRAIAHGDPELGNGDGDTLVSFLSQGDSSDDGAEEVSGNTDEILGILKQLKESMEKDLADATATENGEKRDHDELVGNQQKLIASGNKTIDAKEGRVSQLQVGLVQDGTDLEDTKNALAADKKLSKKMDAQCGQKKEEWAARVQTRKDELETLSQVIHTLNTQEAFHLFKKTLPNGNGKVSFLQMQLETAPRDLRREALQVVQDAHAASSGAGTPPLQLELLALALHGKQVGFAKVTKMIDGMIEVLGKEGAVDYQKKAYCTKELQDSADKGTDLTQASSDMGTAIEEAEGSSTSLAAELEMLIDGIKENDANVAVLTAQRKQENTEFVEELASNNAAADMLKVAERRMLEFYGDDQKVQSFVQLKLKQPKGSHQVAAAPETFGKYKKQTSEGNGVMALIDTLIADLAKSTQEATDAEESAQLDYKDTMEDAAEKRAADSKSVVEKEEVKAGLEAELHKLRNNKKETEAQSADLATYVEQLKGECDWLLANYDARKAARQTEADSMQKAKAVLTGADFS